MEEGLLVKEKIVENNREVSRWEVVREEMKRAGYLGGPMMVVTLSQYLLQVISMMMVGHLDELSLSSTAIATSLTGVTGFSLLLGMASALETLCGQSYGAQQYQKLGIHTYSAIISLFLVCLPLSLIWLNMGKLMILIGQDPQISLEAGKYAMWLIPALFAYANLQALTKHLQSQSLIFPTLLGSFASLCLHIPLCWVLVFKSRLRNVGAALAIGLSYWLNVIFLVLYIKYSSSCEKTRVPLSKEAFKGIGKFFRIGLPSTVMVCLEWWSFELLVLLSGILPNPQLETSVLSICLTTLSFLYTIPNGLGSAASTRVSNELGAGNPQAASVAACVVMFIAVTDAVIVGATILASRHILGYAYSNEKQVVNYVTVIAPLVSLSAIMDGIQGVLSGIARGCGLQHLGAFVNLGAFYLAGIPVAVVLGFVLHLGGKGLWIGILCGEILQTVLLSLLISCTNWQQQAIKARERIFEGKFSTENDASE